MDKQNSKVSVIIPTTAARARRSLLKRAIESIRRSSQFPIKIIAVVNGNRFDVGTCDWLKTQSDILVEYLEKPSAPEAVLRGRELITTEFFSTLDDDDEYLEEATDWKIQLMNSNQAYDLVVTNGYKHMNGTDIIFYSDLTKVSAHPLRCLMSFNWLHNCNALYRTASIETSYFKDSHPYAEWTWLAFKLAMKNKKIGVLNKPTFRYNDTPTSLSKSSSYRNSYLPLFEKMLNQKPPSDIAQLIRRKRGRAWHDASHASLEDGNRLEALKYHWRSLMAPGGYRYLSYTRHLLFPYR
ncbi:glycosyltransferase family A protein [Rhodoferax sediminis]|uniref:Glycosyltransferase family 2 protein n=1 Tax=Rhodoferax sediminis TaxID=2509614 RepID=A0A515D851_9BURK|nr:glycosyltransferase family A protein [Rhodoferax sediminis]QDL36585.1 glycosyltransferase family 2 protein [Rhodoferax sediminis]